MAINSIQVLYNKKAPRARSAVTVVEEVLFISSHQGHQTTPVVDFVVVLILMLPLFLFTFNFFNQNS